MASILQKMHQNRKDDGSRQHNIPATPVKVCLSTTVNGHHYSTPINIAHHVTVRIN